MSLLAMIPTEILLEILSYLSHKELMSKFSVLDKWCYEFSQSPELWRKIIIDKDFQIEEDHFA